MAEVQGIVDTITAAVEGLCACGCGVKLDPDGPSQWYATPDCQWKFQQQHAHDPDDVYARPDAVDVWVGADAMPVPLRDRTYDSYDVTTFRHSGRQREPLRRLSSGPLRHPLSDGHRPEDYWPHERADTDRVRGLTPTRLWLDGVEVTDHVSAIDLNPVIEDTSFGDTDWRETLSGLRSGSMTLTGFYEQIPPHTHWQLWPNEPEPTPTYSADLASAVDEWIAANPTLPQLEPFQREFLVRVYTSPLVPDGQIVLINQPRISFDVSPMRSDSDTVTIRCTATMPAPYGHIAIYDETHGSRYCRLQSETGRAIGTFLAALTARMRHNHRLYRSRQLSRRRRNR